MSTIYRLDLIPMPPSSNNMYATVKIGGVLRRIKSREMRKWEMAVQVWAREGVNAVYINDVVYGLPRGKPLAVYCDFYFKHGRIISKKEKTKKLDVSNRIKPLHDAVFNLLDLDDSLIWYGTFKKCEISGFQVEHVNVKIEAL